MDAIEELRQMHDEARELIRRIEAANPADRGPLWAKLRPSLKLHEHIEEQFVYDPVAREVGDRDPVLRRWEDEHHAQAHEADELMARIGEMDARDDAWLSVFRSLDTMLGEHMAHEEGVIWPQIAAVWGERKVDGAGPAVAAAKSAATSGATLAEALAKGTTAVSERG